MINFKKSFIISLYKIIKIQYCLLFDFKNKIFGLQIKYYKIYRIQIKKCIN